MRKGSGPGALDVWLWGPAPCKTFSVPFHRTAWRGTGNSDRAAPDGNLLQPGCPKLPTSQSFLGFLIPFSAPRPPRPPPAPVGEVAGAAWSSGAAPRWRVWFLRACPSPPWLGLRAAASARVLCPVPVSGHGAPLSETSLGSMVTPLPSFSLRRSPASGPGSAPKSSSQGPRVAPGR